MEMSKSSPKGGAQLYYLRYLYYNSGVEVMGFIKQDDLCKKANCILKQCYEMPYILGGGFSMQFVSASI